MALSAYSLANYRGFADRVDIEIRPITLFFGYNSAGKSALIRALPLLADSMQGEHLSPLNFDSETVRGATFEDLSSKFVPRAEVRVELSWSGDDHARDEPEQSATSELSPVSRVEYTIRSDFPERLMQTLERLQVSAGTSELRIQWAESPARYTVTINSASPASSTSVSGADERLYELQFSGLRPAQRQHVPGAPGNILASLGDRCYDFARSVHWLGPWRETPPRSKEYTQPRGRIGSRGEWAPDVLAYDRLEEGPLVSEVSSWYRAMTRHHLDVIKDAGRFSLVLRPVDASPPVQIPIPDTGEGMAQMLPVLVLGAMARHGKLGSDSIVALEHPSLHLHPAAHEHLALFLAQVSQSPHRPRILFETHSENLLLGIQKAILDGQLPASDVAVYWVRSDDSGRSVADRIAFNDLAEPQGPWPPGVFAEDIELSRYIIHKRRERRERPKP